MSNQSERKCIAVLLSSADKSYQADILKGIYAQAFAADMNVAVFATDIPKNGDAYKEGEMNIFRLVNYSKLAGVIYLPDTVTFDRRDEYITEPLLREVRQNGLPAVTIDYEIEGVPCFLCDDSEVIHEMLRHIIEEHGCRDIAYMTGKKGHPHSEHRLKVYRDTMASYGIPADESRVYYGDFWYDEGENFVKRLLESERGLPEAVVCANRQMAESVYKALFDRGIKVPGQIIVAGYEEGHDKMSLISSTVRNSRKSGEKACEALIRMINGEAPAEQRHYVKCDFYGNYSITCGCSGTDSFNVLDISDYNKADTVNDFFSKFNVMNENMLSRNDYDGVMWTLDWYTYYIKDFSGIYLCLCDGWDDPEKSIDEAVVQKTFTPEMVINYSRFDIGEDEPEKQVGGDRRFSTGLMFPLLYDAGGAPAAYLFRALHFEDRCFGYIVLTYGDRLITPESVYDYWLGNVVNAMESQRRLQNIRYLYRKMQENSVTDLMTGLLNRNGLNIMLPDLLREAREKGLQTLLVMGDLNNLKYINDTFGHAEGDEAIKTASGALARTWIGGAMCEKNFRIGGDEFIKAAYGSFSDKGMTEFKNALTGYLSDFNKNSGKPYPIHLSVGFALCGPDEDISADALLFKADKEMYTDKIRVKRQTGFDPKRED